MSRKVKLVKNSDGTYDLHFSYNTLFDYEFAKEFNFNKKSKKNDIDLSKLPQNIVVKNIKVFLAGVAILSVPIIALSNEQAEMLGVNTSDVNHGINSNIHIEENIDDNKVVNNNNNNVVENIINNDNDSEIILQDIPYSLGYLYGGNVDTQINYVRNTNNNIKNVSPSFFDINANGDLVTTNLNKKLIDEMHKLDVKVVPFLSNHWDRNAGIKALNNIDPLVNKISEYIEVYDLDGINVDIENVTHAEKNKYTELVSKLRAKIPAHKEISVAVAANPYNYKQGWHGSYDYEALAKVSDYLMIMAYDEHYEGGNSGAVASIDFVEKSIQYALARVPSDKIVLGVPLFGRIWSLSDQKFVGNGLSVKMASQIISAYQGEELFDENTKSPFSIIDVTTSQYVINGKQLTPGKYIIWYENDKSISVKMNLMNKYKLKGYGFWALGQEEASIWSNEDLWSF